MSPAETLLSRLQRVRRVRPGEWRASCPTAMHARGDRSAGLSVREEQDGRVLVYCFSGCDVVDVAHSAGLELRDLYPPRPVEHGRPIRRAPIFPHEVFEVARMEVGVAAIIAMDMHKRRAISAGDYERLLTAHDRLEGIARAAYAR